MEEKYGEIEELNICENMSEHLQGNTYAKFRYEEDAEKACLDMNNRWFSGKPIYAELSPVTDFHEASCQFQASDCPRGAFCNFLHLKSISRNLRHKLFTSSRRRRNANRRWVTNWILLKSILSNLLMFAVLWFRIEMVDHIRDRDRGREVPGTSHVVVVRDGARATAIGAEIMDIEDSRKSVVVIVAQIYWCPVGGCICVCSKRCWSGFLLVQYNFSFVK